MFNRPAPLVKRKPDILLNEGDTISFGTLTLEALHTPGHTRGGICLVSRPYCVFTGDTLFNRGIGRTDFEGGSYEQIEKSIREKLNVSSRAFCLFMNLVWKKWSRVTFMQGDCISQPATAKACITVISSSLPSTLPLAQVRVEQTCATLRAPLVVSPRNSIT